MAIRLAADFDSILDVRRDLDAVADGLSRELTQGIQDDFDQLISTARQLTPIGPGPRPGAFESDDALPHIRDTYSMVVQGGTVAMVTSHPGAVVLEFGGTIRPRGYPIVFQPEAMARRAAVQELPTIERAVDSRIDKLLRKAFTGGGVNARTQQTLF